MYKGTIYLTEGHPRPTEVTGFLSTRFKLAKILKKLLDPDEVDDPFPEDAAFEMETIGKRRPRGVPLAELCLPQGAEEHASEKRHSKKKHMRSRISDKVKMFVWQRDEAEPVNDNGTLYGIN